MRRLFFATSVILAALAFCVFYAKDSLAIGSVNGTLNITATVPSGCAVTTTPVSFGAYLSNQPADVYATGAISVNCPFSTIYSVDLGSGIYYPGAVTFRRMNNGGIAAADYLNYYMYWGCNWCTLAGTGVMTGSTTGGTGNLTWQNYTIYGIISGAQVVNPGSFSDSVTVTVSW